MRGPSINYRMRVSDELLDASIDAIHRCSLTTRRFESLHTTIGWASAWMIEGGIDVETMRSFLGRCPLEGPHTITLTVDHRWKSQFLEAGELMSKALKVELSPKQRFAILTQQLPQNGKASDSKGC